MFVRRLVRLSHIINVFPFFLQTVLAYFLFLPHFVATGIHAAHIA